MERIAVDTTAEDYWETYFGPYGKQWVRKIPRRIATAVAQRTASQDSAATAPSAARVVPVMERPVITADRVIVEGAVDLVTDGKTARRLFTAEFDHVGRLLSLDSIPAPCAT